MNSNPLKNNPFRTRDDASEAVRELLEPLCNHFDAHGARCLPGHKHAHFDQGAAGAEGVCRPLWGLMPLLAGGGTWDRAALFLDGVINGTDESHPGFWGNLRDFDQRIVESAAIGVALMLKPEALTDRPNHEGMLRWLASLRNYNAHPNNWRWFRVLVAIGLERVGTPADDAQVREDLDLIDSCALDEGWYADGIKQQRDYYIPMAMHFYGLIFAANAPDRYAADAERFKKRAADFAPQFSRWFADDGSAVPFGRSLTYRFATGAFWGALAYADVKPDSLSWGHIRGLWARHMRSWSSANIASSDGVLSVGYGYPSELMSEQYNSSSSPYWCMKAFLPIAIPDSHPFWSEPEEDHPCTSRTELASQRAPHAIMMRHAGDVTMLTGGQVGEMKMRAIASKYSKFAYSSRFGFSVPSDARTSNQCAPDSSLIVSTSEQGPWIMRMACTYARTGERFHLSTWSPTDGIDVTTLLVPLSPFHVRVHEIKATRNFFTAEGGFSAPIDDNSPPPRGEPTGTISTMQSRLGSVAIIDRSPAPRIARLIGTDPGTNVLFPRAAMPMLEYEIQPGRTMLACAVYASPENDKLENDLARAPRVSIDAGAVTVSFDTTELVIDINQECQPDKNELHDLDR